MIDWERGAEGGQPQGLMAWQVTLGWPSVTITNTADEMPGKGSILGPPVPLHPPTLVQTIPWLPGHL